MDQRGDEIHASTTEVSGGSREGVVRWVLVIGLLLVVALFAIIVATGVLSQDEGDDSHQNVNREILHDRASGDAQGEPTMPGFEEKADASTAATVPGDAPAGDPKSDAQ